MTAVARARSVGTSDDWIVCLDQTRVASSGLVACPVRGGSTATLDECWECHLLTWRCGKRDLPDSCSTLPNEYDEGVMT